MNEQVAKTGIQGQRPKMIRAELMGGHTHKTQIGVEVHVWRRGQKFIARGRLQGQPFGKTIGESVDEATARLRQILNELDNGTYVRPSEARKRPLANAMAPRLSLRQLIDEFLADRRRTCGKRTSGNYRARLMPVLAFAERTENVKHCRLAMDIDREFVTRLQAFLFEYRTTRNGRPGGEPKPLSPRQIFNVLQCLSTLFAWAHKAAVRKLPADWVNPLTREIIGSRPPKDPLREDKLPLEARIKLVGIMDQWQLCHLAPSLVLPLRPDEAEGLLVTDVDFERSWLEFGQKFSDVNFTKEATAFRLPFPEELEPILRACIGNRVEGPLLLGRKAFTQGGGSVASTIELRRLFDKTMSEQPSGSIQCAHDRKLFFRNLLHELGGVADNELAKEFKKLLSVLGIDNGSTFYTLRSSVTTAMKDARLPHLELRYLTSHSTNDILNDYARLDPVGAMQPYFLSIQPLLNAITDRASELGLLPERPQVAEPQYLSPFDRMDW
jgi:integrase